MKCLVFGSGTVRVRPDPVFGLNRLQEQVDQTLLSVQHFTEGSQLIHGPHGITIVDGPEPYFRGNGKTKSHT